MSKELLLPGTVSPYQSMIFSNDQRQSIFYPEEPSKSPPFLVDFVDASLSSGSYPTYYFKTPAYGNRLGTTWLEYSIGPIALTGGTYARLPQYGGLRLIDHITVRYGSNQLETFTGQDILSKIQSTELAELQDITFARVGGNMTDAERNQAATAVQTFRVPIPFFWADDPRCNIAPAVFNQPIDIEIGMVSQLANVVQTDATAVSTTWTDPKLKFMAAMVTDAEMVSYNALINSSTGLFTRSDVIQSLMSDTIPANATNFKIKLDAIRNYVTYMLIEVHGNSDVSVPLAYNPDNYIVWSRFRISANQSDLVRWTSYDFAQNELWKMYFSPIPMVPGLVAISFAAKPTDPFNYSGAVNFAGFSDPILELEFAAGALTDPLGYRCKVTYITCNGITISSNSAMKLLV